MARKGHQTAFDPAPGDVYTTVDGSAWVVTQTLPGRRVDLEQLRSAVVRTWSTTVPALLPRIDTWRKRTP